LTISSSSVFLDKNQKFSIDFNKILKGELLEDLTNELVEDDEENETEDKNAFISDEEIYKLPETDLIRDSRKMNCRGLFLVYSAYNAFLERDYNSCQQLCRRIYQCCLVKQIHINNKQDELDSSRLFSANMKKLRSLNSAQIFQ
jgi:hypothetical protein